MPYGCTTLKHLVQSTHMRYILGVIVVILVGLYFTIGIRAGYLTLTPVMFVNANGTNSYQFRTLEDGQKVGLQGKCTVRSGSAVVSIFDTSGGQVGAQACNQKGTFGLNLMAGGPVGNYTIKVVFKNFNGDMELEEIREGKW